MENLAEITLWGELVGALIYNRDSRLSTFEYAPEWIESDVDLAPLHMPLTAQKYSFAALNYATYKGLPAVFADTLPDDFGNAVIDAWLARTGRDAGSFTALERLLYSGNHGMGALEYAPSIKPSVNAAETIELHSLINMVQKILDDRAAVAVTIQPAAATSTTAATTTMTTESEDALAAILQVGTSAGGARPKALIAINKDRSIIRSGQIDAPPEFEHYLLKFDGVEEHKINSEIFADPQGFGRMEYAYYLMACDAGIAMSPSELLMDGERAHFMTKRFDRKGNEKIHYQSLCAMDHADYKKPGSYSYEQLFSVARQLRLPRIDAIELYRRMAFNVVARNHDDHSKNVGFVMNSTERRWRLAPAFDVAYSYKKDSPWVNAHQLSINGKRDGFTRDDLLAIAALIGNFNKESASIIDTVIEVVSQWESYASKVGVFDDFSREIKRNHRLHV
ncbi:MAG: type II toxin-antitoxin system HipA family toxin [Pseudomonadales bacterium]